MTEAGCAAMRIGTWNLDGRWDARRLAFLERLACDVLLLTEVPHAVAIPGMNGHATTADMADQRSWAAIWSRQPLAPLTDPHPASAMAEIGGLRFCASVLPWGSSGRAAPWTDGDLGERLGAVATEIVAAGPEVWGGDWNQELTGPTYTGSRDGRAQLTTALDRLGLVAPTADAPHREPGCCSIDHVAVPNGWSTRLERHVALSGTRRLSDHDAYVVEALHQL